MLPIVLGYTGYCYYVIPGKASEANPLIDRKKRHVGLCVFVVYIPN